MYVLPSGDGGDDDDEYRCEAVRKKRKSETNQSVVLESAHTTYI